MVEIEIMQKILKRLEKYLIRKNNFQLTGETYDLILFIPSDTYEPYNKLTLLVSYSKFNDRNQRDVIKELLTEFKDVLRFEEYNSISRLNIIHSKDPFVENLKASFRFRAEVIAIKDVLIGGVQINIAYLAKSLVLDKLVRNSALTIEILDSENNRQTIPAGIVRIEPSFEVVYYTGKGLREIWRPDISEDGKANVMKLKSQSETYLMENNYLSKIHLDRIIQVL